MCISFIKSQNQRALAFYHIEVLGMHLRNIHTQSTDIYCTLRAISSCSEFLQVGINPKSALTSSMMLHNGQHLNHFF